MAYFAENLKKAGLQVFEQIPLYKYSTIKIGGNAKYFVEVKTVDQATKAFKIALNENIPVFVLGGGSNVLISDTGFNGIVIKNSIAGIEYIGQEKINFREQHARKEETTWSANLLSLDDISFTPSEPAILAKVMSGTSLPYTLTNTIEHNATGLQIFAGVPGTIGGAIWNNIHGAKWLIGQFIRDVTFIDEKGALQTKTPEQLHFKYNSTDFRTSKAFIVSAIFTLFEGGKDQAREVANEWISRKKIQPKNSLGCTFNNLTDVEKSSAGLENLSAAYVIDKILGLKGFKIGGVQVSESHANFIAVEKNARADDYIALVEKIKKECFEKTGIELKEEIVRVGEFNYQN